MYPRYSFFVILVLSLFIIPSLKAGSKKPTDDPLLDKKQDVTTENNNTTFSLNRSTVKPVNSTLFFPSGFLETLPTVVNNNDIDHSFAIDILFLEKVYNQLEKTSPSALVSKEEFSELKELFLTYLKEKHPRIDISRIDFFSLEQKESLSVSDLKDWILSLKKDEEILEYLRRSSKYNEAELSLLITTNGDMNKVVTESLQLKLIKKLLNEFLKEVEKINPIQLQEICRENNKFLIIYNSIMALSCFLVDKFHKTSPEFFIDTIKKEELITYLQKTIDYLNLKQKIEQGKSVNDDDINALVTLIRTQVLKNDKHKNDETINKRNLNAAIKYLILDSIEKDSGNIQEARELPSLNTTEQEIINDVKTNLTEYILEGLKQKTLGLVNEKDILKELSALSALKVVLQSLDSSSLSTLLEELTTDSKKILADTPLKTFKDIKNSKELMNLIHKHTNIIKNRYFFKRESEIIKKTYQRRFRENRVSNENIFKGESAIIQETYQTRIIENPVSNENIFERSKKFLPLLLSFVVSYYFFPGLIVPVFLINSLLLLKLLFAE